MSISKYGDNPYSNDPVYEDNQILAISYTVPRMGDLSMAMYNWSAQEGVMIFNLDELIKSKHEMNLILEMIRASRSLSIMGYGIPAEPIEVSEEAEE